MRSLQILVIDDEPAIREILQAQLVEDGHSVFLAANGEEALIRLGRGDIDVALCDIRMPGISGLEVLERAKATNLDTVFIMITAYSSLDNAINAMRSGAYDYLVKPLRPDELKHRLRQLSEIISIRTQNKLLRNEVNTLSDNRCQLVSSLSSNIEKLMLKVAATDSTVLITGPSGTGKGVMAKSIHNNSNRVNGSFVSVNCGAIPENLLESEFFGHTKGAFTGAVKAKRGLFVKADMGTLFLDEIGDLPLPLQVKLLHAIEDGSVRAVGSEQSRPVNVRLITATNCDLQTMVSQKLFREDLFFRLNVFNIDIPPLSKRPADIVKLIEHFTEVQSRKINLSGSYSIVPEALELLCNFSYPGNIRELQNIVTRALVLAEDQCIRICDLPDYVTYDSTKAITHSRDSLREQVKVFETQIIKNAIEDAGGDRKMAARQLDIALSSLYRKFDESADEG